MGCLNQVTLIGNLGADAEIKNIKGSPLATFSLATTERFKNRAGEQEEKTDWHRCNFWGKGVDAIGQYLLKGTQLSVIGSIHTRTYEKDGEKRYMTEIRVYRIVLLGKPVPKNAPPSPSEDDIPF